MNDALHCHCGFATRAESENELVAEVRSHAWEAHGMALSYDEALVLTLRAELEGGGPRTVPREPATRRDEEE